MQQNPDGKKTQAKGQEEQRYLRILIPAVIVVFVLYLIFSIWIGLRNPYTFTAAYTDTMEDSAPASGWVVRSEQPIPAAEGLTQIEREENEKVAKDAVIAIIYQDEAYQEHQAELLQTRSDLGSMQYATYRESPSGVALENQMRAAMTALRTASSSGNYTNLEDQADTYRKLVLRREYLVSNEAAAAMDQWGWQLNQRYKELQNSSGGVTTITAAAAGSFSTQMDGYETLLSPDDLDGVSPAGLAAFGDLTPLNDSGYLGKLITSTQWYYAVTMEAEPAQQLQAGKTVQIYFDALATTLNMTVETVGEPQDGQVVVIFRSAQNEEEAAGLRQESCRVVFRTREGIRVPKKAVYIVRDEEDGTEETGVYVALGYTARFRPVSIVAEDESSYLVEPDPVDETDKRILNTGDDIVVSSVELYDGKVVR